MSSGPTQNRAGGAKHLRAALGLLALLLLGFATANAVEPNERLANPALEARARAISSQLRCLVCQNESIDESAAGLAHDIRIFVRERLVAGETDKQVVQDVVNRYGTFVLLDPPVQPATYVLWYGPPALLLVGLLATVIWVRQRHARPAAEPPLSTDERQRLDGLLRESDG
ncbi:MAG TPA: cytochrome c-type biogenesis protein CcmH [Rhodopila sp.]|nr:cytochrome c-type biogenesis protein CcmH [Rhodopila sp.]